MAGLYVTVVARLWRRPQGPAFEAAIALMAVALSYCGGVAELATKLAP